jgi:hypothetical protein
LSIPFGEVVPICIGCICLAAFLASKGKWRYAAVAIAGAFIEPHLALPAAIGLFILAPRSRAALILIGVVLAAVSLAVLGPNTNIEYVASVLPAHILSEIHRDTQYSLTEFLVSIGTPIGLAIKTGTIWYLAMVALGTLVGLRLASKTHNAAFAVCVPPAFAVFGGTFIHATQIAVAVPAAILLSEYTERKARDLVVVALLALSVPWGWVVSLALLLAPIFPVAYIARTYWTQLRAVLSAAVACAAISLLIVAMPRGKLQRIQPDSIAIDHQLAEYSWGAFTQTFTRHDPVSWILRIPTWGGLFLLLLVATSEGSRTRTRVLPELEYAHSEQR